MRKGMIALLLALAFAAPALSQPESGTPKMSSVDPAIGKIGDIMTVAGDVLGADTVAAVYLTDGKIDTKVIIIEQTPKSIKFKIPPQAKTGRFALMVLTKGETAKLIEEPVKVTVEEASPIT